MSISLMNAAAKPASDEYFDLGSLVWPINSTNKDAQTWFNRGLIWCLSFNHDEAVACFRQVTTHDPSCAMGYWGAAYALGPNYNKPWSFFSPDELKGTVQKCFDGAQMAERCSATGPPLEKALIAALQHRYPTRQVPDDFKPSTLAYADAMREVYRSFGKDDLNVTYLAAEALMNVSPWSFFDTNSGEPNPETAVFEVRAMLEHAMELPSGHDHPGILHMYIHLMEMSKQPEKAVDAADYLRELVPDSGHVHHMPSHIDLLVGDYRRAVHSNLKAVKVDERYYEKEGDNNFYSIYRVHNYHSLIFAAMMAGQKSVAVEAANRVESTISDEFIAMKSPPMADFVEFSRSLRVHVLIRFGMWEELKRLPLPADAKLFCCTVTSLHYGKAVAFAATGDIQAAEEEPRLFLAAQAAVPETRIDFPNKMNDVFKVAEAMLDGELEYRKQNFKAAFESLQLAVQRDDKLHYSEPWSWMLPARHSCAALLLEQGHVQEAADLYAEDLGLNKNLCRAHQHPNNLWALHGYRECLNRLGRHDEARNVNKQPELAQAGTDILLTGSCFCRRNLPEDEIQLCCDNERLEEVRYH